MLMRRCRWSFLQCVAIDCGRADRQAYGIGENGCMIGLVL